MEFVFSYLLYLKQPRQSVKSLLLLKFFFNALTRKQKAKERRSRQLDIISDVENADVLLRNYSIEDEANYQSDSQLKFDQESIRPQQNSNVVGVAFRSLLTNSRENSEITIETIMISDDVSSQVTRRLNEIEDSLHFQIQNVITTAIAEKCFLLFKIRLIRRGGIISPSWTESPTGYRKAQGGPISPWWTKGPMSHIWAQGQHISPWWTQGPTGYRRA